MPTQNAETALAPTHQAASEKIITSTDVYRDRLASWNARHFTVLSPAVEISGLAVQFGIIASKVLLDVNPDAGDVYGNMPWLKADELALAKNGLRKIASAAGISTTTVRTDPRTIPNYWEMKCIASWRDIDGSVTTRECTKDWDARDGSDLLKGFTANQIQQARKNGLRHCEARATNAAIREYGLKQKFTKEELAKPFVVLRICFMPNMDDPETRRIVTERALGGTNAMYPARELPSHADAIDAEPVSEAPRAVDRGATTAPPAPDPNGPPTADAVRIVKVESKSGEKNGRAWTCWTVIDSNGAEYSTFSSTIAAAAEKFKTSRAWVDIRDEQNGEYRNINEIGPAQASLLPDPASL